MFFAPDAATGRRYASADTRCISFPVTASLTFDKSQRFESVLATHAETGGFGVVRLSQRCGDAADFESQRGLCIG